MSARAIGATTDIALEALVGVASGLHSSLVYIKHTCEEGYSKGKVNINLDNQIQLLMSNLGQKRSLD